MTQPPNQGEYDSESDPPLDPQALSLPELMVRFQGDAAYHDELFARLRRVGLRLVRSEGGGEDVVNTALQNALRNLSKDRSLVPPAPDRWFRTIVRNARIDLARSRVTSPSGPTSTAESVDLGNWAPKSQPKSQTMSQPSPGRQIATDEMRALVFWTVFRKLRGKATLCCLALFDLQGSVVGRLSDRELAHLLGVQAEHLSRLRYRYRSILERESVATTVSEETSHE